MCRVKSNMLHFAGLVLIALKAPTALGLVCLVCDHVSSIRDCPYIETCGSHEVCYLEGRNSSNGHALYQGGCRERQKCFTATTVGKRTEAAFCSQCCDHNLCQASLCGGTGYSPNRGPMCYDCPEGLNQGDYCDRIIEASHDQVCTESMRLSLQGTLFYATSLLEKNACDRALARLAAENLHITGANGSCFNCCSGDLCNNRCNLATPIVQVCKDASTPETCKLAAAYICGDKTMATNAGCLHYCGLC
ncbi:uncharacterized protein LOC127867695 isoform X1 [Dreissena polymorpha]|uniref:uncharacterized protein LOC127867695 isoform X1 n=1 Tax=Dreissena polymorpha TaxID=45954 RepID=UPI0022641724|nr:uncharacterized protein LOC127867695 isoform X1 [Dreissena polymorpha]